MSEIFDCSFNITDTVCETTLINDKAEKFKQQSLLSGKDFKNQEEVLTFVKKAYGVAGVNRFKIAKVVLGARGLVPTNDFLLAISSTKKSKIVLATAGAGKTTMLQLDIIVSKLIDNLKGTSIYSPREIANTGVMISRILFLNYNKHNREPAIQRHKEFVASINRVLKPNERISDDLESSTVHAFCRKYVNIYKEKLGYSEIKIIDGATKTKILDAVIKPRWEKISKSEMPKTLPSEIDSLYNFKEESMLEWDSFFMSAPFIESELPSEFVKSCITKYDAMKKTLKVFDFIDFIKEFIRLLNTFDDVREEITNSYSLIIADEAQDFTALMNEVLKVMQTQNNKIIVVGDPDQMIYSFRGVSSDNILNIADELDDSEILTLDTNFRCPRNIVDAANGILDLNVLRFDREINCVRDGGNIVFKPYSNIHEEYNYITNYLSKLSDNDLQKTVIAFRNNDSAVILTEELYYADIPYNISDVNKPFNNEIFTRLYNVLCALSEQDNTSMISCLWQVLPVTKNTWLEIIEANKKNRISSFADFNFGAFVLPESFQGVFDDLSMISNNINSLNCSQYIEKIVEYFRLYSYNFLYKSVANTSCDNNRNDDTAELYLSRAVKFFNRDLVFDKIKSDYVRSQRNSAHGVSVSTMHALKGLEYDTVIVADMVDTVFPNFQLIDTRFPNATAVEVKEAENRLCYVLITRAKKNLIFMYDERDPSAYLQIIRQKGNNILDFNDAIVPRVQCDDNADLISKRNFITRIMGIGR